MPSSAQYASFLPFFLCPLSFLPSRVSPFQFPSSLLAYSCMCVFIDLLPIPAMRDHCSQHCLSLGVMPTLYLVHVTTASPFSNSWVWTVLQYWRFFLFQKFCWLFCFHVCIFPAFLCNLIFPPFQLFHAVSFLPFLNQYFYTFVLFPVQLCLCFSPLPLIVFSPSLPIISSLETVFLLSCWHTCCYALSSVACFRCSLKNCHLQLRDWPDWENRGHFLGNRGEDRKVALMVRKGRLWIIH